MTAEHPAFAGERVLDALEIAVAVYDRDGRRVFVNRRAHDGMELLGEAFALDGTFGDVELIDEHGTAIRAAERPWFRTIETGEGIENAVLGARSPRHPAVIWIMVTCLPLLDERRGDRRGGQHLRHHDHAQRGRWRCRRRRSASGSWPRTRPMSCTASPSAPNRGSTT